MTEEEFDILPGEHPIVPVMVGDAVMASRMAAVMLEKGVYVIGFSYPVVPQGKARIRTQLSAVHSPDDLERAVQPFVQSRQELATGGTASASSASVFRTPVPPQADPRTAGGRSF